MKKHPPSGPVDVASLKRKNVERYRKSLRNGETDVPNSPAEIYVEVSGRCNIVCANCAMHYFPDDPKYQGVMPPGLFDKLEPIFPHAVTLNAFGFGEPTTNRHFLDMLKTAKAHSLHVQFFSNGAKLTDRHVTRFVELGVDRIVFSINAGTPAVYDLIHKGATFERTFGSIRAIAGLKKALGVQKPVLDANFVLWNVNHRELTPFLREAAKAGIGRVTVNPLVTYTEESRSLRRNYRPDRDDEWLDAARSAAIEEGIDLQLDDYLQSRIAAAQDLDMTVEKAEEPGPPAPPEKDYAGGGGAAADSFCFLPFRTVYVAWTGQVMPCCFSGRYELGDLNEKGILEIWNGERFREMRRQLLGGETPPGCVHCVQFGLKPKTDSIFDDMQRLENSLGPRRTDVSDAGDGKTIKAAYFVDREEPERAGDPCSQALEMAGELARRGHEAAVWRWGDGAAQAAGPEGTDLEGLRLFKAADAGPGGATAPDARAPGGRMDEWLDESRPDVIHVCGAGDFALKAAAAARKRKIPCVLEPGVGALFCGLLHFVRPDGSNCSPALYDEGRGCANCLKDSPHETAGGALLEKIESWKRAAALCDRIVLSSHTQRDRHLECGFRDLKGSFCVLPPGAPNERTPRPARPAGARSRFGCVGGADRREGLETFLDAARRIPPGAAEWTVFSSEGARGGEEGWRSGFPPGAAVAVHPMRGGSWREAFERIDVLAVPSLWPETRGYHAREALAAGVPVLAARTGALTEIVRDGVDGLFFSPGDADGLARILRRLTESPEEIDRLASGVRLPFTLRDRADKLESLYRELIEIADDERTEGKRFLNLTEGFAESKRP